MSFIWSKQSGDAVNRALGTGAGAIAGPTLLLILRFGLAAVLWAACFPSSLRGWTPMGIARAATIGALMCAGMTLQMLGLDRTSPAVNAFLTSLTIVFVPIIQTLAMKRPPAPKVWFAVAIATIGIIALSAGEDVSKADIVSNRKGILLGLACAIVFSFQIIMVNKLVPKETPQRIGFGSFLFVTLGCGVFLIFKGYAGVLAPARIESVLKVREVWLNLALLIVFCTVAAFFLMNRFQPSVEPTQAALIYLFEPIIAAGFAFLWSGTRLTMLTVVGAIMILGANLIVELKGSDKVTR